MNRICGDMWIVLSRPGPGSVNRLAMLFVFPEPVKRLAVLAVLVQAGPGIRNVTFMNSLAVLFV